MSKKFEYTEKMGNFLYCGVCGPVLNIDGVLCII